MTAPARGANLVNLEAVSKAFGTTTLLADVSLGVAAGERIGVVGPNGGGKTTLLRVLTRLEPPDQGRVTLARDLRVGVVDQQAALPAGRTVRELVLAGFGAEHEWAGDAAVRAVLAGLGLAGAGLAEAGLDGPVDQMSGGERRRVALAAELVRPTDLLVLDEPTNHLDVEGVRWLADHLRGRRGALVVVTHDRWFLDAVCETTWEVGGGQVRSYEGGYSAYVLARAERARQAAATESRRQNLLRKELAWLRRGPPARTSKPRFRIDAAQALIADEPPPRDRTGLHAFAARRLGKTVYDLEGLTARIGDRTLLDDVTWRVGPGDRIGLIGVNGSGKTTLLRLLAGVTQAAPAPPAGTTAARPRSAAAGAPVPSASGRMAGGGLAAGGGPTAGGGPAGPPVVADLAVTGRVVVGKTVRVGYLSQEVAELPGQLRLLEAVEQVARLTRVGDVELTASQLAERFGFGASRQWTPVADLSGGERRRLQLLRLLMSEPNVLLLDEPTNDLDIDTLTALEDLLDGWPGTLVVASHDRYLIERVCDTVVAITAGALAELPGGVEQYLTQRAAASAGPAGAPVAAGSAPAAPRGGEIRAARKELARLERRIATLEAREAELHDALARHATDYTRVSELDTELRAVRTEREAVETAWLELSE
ncbi:MAG: transport system ATP-binding/permease protein [Mycobacteriales bacterium]